MKWKAFKGWEHVVISACLLAAVVGQAFQLSRLKGRVNQLEGIHVMTEARLIRAERALEELADRNMNEVNWEGIAALADRGLEISIVMDDATISVGPPSEEE